MQSAKINPKNVYAIKQDGKLVRFRVEAVVTRRTGQVANPAEVEGHILGEDNEGVIRKTTVEASALLGLYTEHAELVAREKAARAKADAEEAARREKVAQLLAALYEATGLQQPVDSTKYPSPFRLNYGWTDITIGIDAFEPLAKILADRAQQIQFLRGATPTVSSGSVVAQIRREREEGK